MAEASAKDSVVHLVHRASQRGDELFALHADGFSPRQYEVLRAVAQGNGISQADITAATGIDRSSTAVFVARLMRQGLLKRRRLKRDHRSYAVRLTPAGQEMFDRMNLSAAKADEAFLAPLSSDQRQSLILIIGILIKQRSGDATGA